MCEKVAKAAAKWWIEQMKKRCTTLYPNRIIKDKNGFIITDEFLKEELERFEKSLVCKIQDSLQKFHYMNLGCCYSPDSTLLEIAKQSQIHISYFPIHADMQIQDTSIRVAIGEDDLHDLRI